MKIIKSAEKSLVLGRKAPSDRFPAQFFIILPSRGPVAEKIAVLRAVTRFFARNFSFSFAVASPRSHFHRVLNLNVWAHRTARSTVGGGLCECVDRSKAA